MTKTACGFEDNPNGYSGKDALIVYGPTLYVQVGFDPAYRSGIPELPAENHPALVDTGALASCIDSRLAEELQLPTIDRQSVSGVHGSSQVNIHLAQIYIPNLTFTIYGQFAGVHLQAGGQLHKALIGRTFLEKFSMDYDGSTGSVILSR